MKYTKTYNRRGEGKIEETHKGGSERLEGFANTKKKKHIEKRAHKNIKSAIKRGEQLNILFQP